MFDSVTKFSSRSRWTWSSADVRSHKVPEKTEALYANLVLASSRTWKNLSSASSNVCKARCSHGRQGHGFTAMKVFIRAGPVSSF